MRVAFAILSYPTTGFSPPVASARTLPSTKRPPVLVLMISWNGRAAWLMMSTLGAKSDGGPSARVPSGLLLPLKA